MQQGHFEFHTDQFSDVETMGGACGLFYQDLDEFCEEYAHLASDAALQRKRQTQRRLACAQALWDDPVRFEAIVASGRYLRLRNLIEAISDSDGRAWRRLKNEILAVREKEFLWGDAPTRH